MTYYFLNSGNKDEYLTVPSRTKFENLTTFLFPENIHPVYGHLCHNKSMKWFFSWQHLRIETWHNIDHYYNHVVCHADSFEEKLLPVNRTESKVKWRKITAQQIEINLPITRTSNLNIINNSHLLILEKLCRKRLKRFEISFLKIAKISRQGKDKS